MLRFVASLSCVAVALGFAATAVAGPINAPPAAIGPELQEALEDDYGVREADALRRDLTRALERALSDVDATLADTGAPVTLEVTILNAKPNRPTLEQLRDQPALSFALSRSIGGAALEGVLRDAEGRELARVESEFFETDIRDTIGASTWHDARRAMRRFANDVAEAYAALPAG